MKKLFIILACLNLVDGAITFYGLFFTYIAEANPMMNALYDINPFLFLSIKIALSFFLVTLSFFHRIEASFIVKKLTIFATVAYSIIFFLHGYWLIQLI